MADTFSPRTILADAWQELIQRGWFGRNGPPPESLDRSAGEHSCADRLGWSQQGERASPSAEQGWFARSFAPDVTRDSERVDPAARDHENERSVER